MFQKFLYTSLITAIIFQSISASEFFNSYSLPQKPRANSKETYKRSHEDIPSSPHFSTQQSSIPVTVIACAQQQQLQKSLYIPLKPVSCKNIPVSTSQARETEV